jgi:hypothetical protein
MPSIAIDRVDARYRIPRQHLREQPRLQRIVDDALTRVLEGAIARERIDDGAYICIDAVTAVATIRLREPDAALASGVGDAIAAAIRRIIDEGPASVVRYGSKPHALVDLAASAMAGDFTRSWAWTQLGIWRSDFALRADATADLIVRTLAREPRHAIAVIGHLASHHRRQFHELAARATQHAWAQVAYAVIQSVDAGAVAAAGRATAVITVTASADERSIGALASRVVSTSPIARAALLARSRLTPETLAALVTLAIVETEPSAIQSALDLERALLAVVRLITAPDAKALTVLNDPDADPHSERIGPAAVTQELDLPREGDAVSPFDRARTDPIGSAQPAPSVRADAATREHEPATAPPDVRVSAHTRQAGVLYLLNLLPRMGVIDRLRIDPCWSGRGLRWVLHQLAMRLAPIAEDDPAALAFAGLGPAAALPSAMQEPATTDERAALDSVRAEISLAVHARLGGALDGEPLTASELLARICHRPAAIVADPGWIEARFALDDVSLDVRRSGLDVNPDWLPWLGVVVRFVYA